MCPLTLSLLWEVCKVTQTFESADQILWCDHSNESSLLVLTHGAICFSKFQKMKFGNLFEIYLWLYLAVKRLRNCWRGKTARRHHLLPREITSEKRAQKLHTKTWHYPDQPVKTVVSCRSSPLGTSEPKRQKFHTDDLKAVRSLVRNSDWSTQQLYCYERQLKGKQSQRSNIDARNLLQTINIREIYYSSGKAINFAGARSQKSSKRYHDQP